MKQDTKEILKAFIRSLRQLAALLERVLRGKEIQLYYHWTTWLYEIMAEIDGHGFYNCHFYDTPMEGVIET